MILDTLTGIYLGPSKDHLVDITMTIEHVTKTKDQLTH